MTTTFCRGKRLWIEMRINVASAMILKTILLCLLFFGQTLQVKSLAEGSADETLFYSGDDYDDTESSGVILPKQSERPRGLCEKARDAIMFHKMPKEHNQVPSCELDGSYSPVQCNHDDDCYCVNRDGQRVQSASRVFTRHTINCSPSAVESGSDFSYTEPPPASDSSTKGSAPVREDSYDDHTHDWDLVLATAEHTGLFSDPIILAGIIGGAVIGVLCAMLLVMFIVYRMRKKDEGSYSLDEPQKKSPTHGYTRANDREFFA